MEGWFKGMILKKLWMVVAFVASVFGVSGVLPVSGEVAS